MRATHAAINSILEAINYCGGTCACSGCANTNSMILAEPTVVGDTAGPSMAHEFGHTVGLGHQAHHRKIMYGTADANKRRLSESECDAFTMPNLASNGGPSGEQMAPSSEPGTFTLDGPPADFTGVSIQQVALNGFHDTVPVEVEEYYGQGDVELLRDMLRNPKFAKNWRTVASLIGLISNGSDLDSEALINFYSKSEQTETNKVAAGMGLGYLSARTNNRAAMQYLLKASRSSDGGDVKGSVFGLSLSGKPEAVVALRRLEAGLDASSLQIRDAVSRDTVDQALTDHQRIASAGLRSYYHRTR